MLILNHHHVKLGPGGYAIVDPDGNVLNVVVAENDDPWGTGSPGGIPDDLDSQYDSCNGNCKLVGQSNSGAYWGTYSHNDEIFTLENGTIIKMELG